MITKRNGTWHLHRRVPARYQKAAGGSGQPREQIWRSLHTDSESEARAKAEVVWRELLAAWDAKVFGETDDANRRLEAAKRLAGARGVRFMKAKDVARMPTRDLVERIEMIGGTADDPDDLEGEAFLGAAPEAKITVSQALDLFFDLTGDEVLRKSPDQQRRWRAPRVKSIRNFIGVVKDKPLDEITREDLNDFRGWLVGKMREGKFKSNNANKDLMNVGRVFRTVNERKRLGLTLDFRGLSIKGGDEGTRLPFSDAWIKEKLFAPGALDGLNLEARCVLLTMVNTGARPSEIANLEPEHIHLGAGVPHISIEPTPKRQLKSPNARRRLPLVGVSLEAMRQCPQGFQRYADNPGLSDTTNKFLRENGLIETPEHTVYSLRHSFEDRMIGADFTERIKADLMGHRLKRERYGAGATLEHVQKLLQGIAL